MNKLVLLLVFFASLVVAKPETDCDICQTLIQAVEKWMEQNQTETQIENDLDTVCKYMSIWDSVCETMVNTGVPQIVQWIETNEDPKTVCGQMGICAARTPIKKPIKFVPKPPQDANCDICTYAVGAIENWLESNATEQQIIQNLEQFCALFPDQQQCDDVIVAEVPQIIKWIEQDETPTQVCDQLGLCNSTRRKLIREKISALKQLALKVNVNKPQDTNCDICTYAVGAVEDWLENNATEQEIIQNLEQFCALFPDQQQCDDVIVAEVPQIVKWLEQNETPTQVCTQLGLCTSVPIMPPKPKVKIFHRPTVQKPQDVNCDICTYAVGAVEDWLENNATEQQIEQNLEQFCALFPDQQQCDDVIVAEVPQIVKWLEQNESPNQVCTQLGLCTSRVVKPKPQPKPHHVIQPKQSDCTICTYAVGAVEDWLENNATEQEIVQNLEQFCALFPDQQQCDDVIVAEVPQIVKWIEQNESPTQVCTQLGLCTSRLVIPKDAPCFGCEAIISSMESWIEDSSNEQEIVLELDTLCTLVPSLQAQCDAIVAEGVNNVVNYIEENETPEQVCTQIGFCSSVVRLPIQKSENKQIKIRI